jgi:hypothetical protein
MQGEEEEKSVLIIIIIIIIISRICLPSTLNKKEYDGLIKYITI